MRVLFLSSTNLAMRLLYLDLISVSLCCARHPTLTLCHCRYGFPLTVAIFERLFGDAEAADRLVGCRLWHLFRRLDIVIEKLVDSVLSVYAFDLLTDEHLH